jgi:uncharacterized protein YecT (DUF1311 family)
MYVGPINNEPDDAYFQAVANFQHSRNIVQDGLVGGETYGKLREAWPGFFDQQQSTPTQATGPSSTPAQATAPSSVQATVFDQTSARPSPGVNCTPSGSQDEHAICGSARLCELDWQLYGVYEASRKRLDKSQQAQLARDESAWVRKRGECLGDERCIAAQYKLRIDQLQSGQ